MRRVEIDTISMTSLGAKMDGHRKTAPAHLQMSLVGHGSAITMVLLLEFVRQAATASHETPHDSMLRTLVVLNGNCLCSWGGSGSQQGG